MRTRSLLVAAITSVIACNDNNSTTSNGIIVGTDQVVAVSFADAVSQETAFFFVVAESFDPNTTTDVNAAATTVMHEVNAFFSPGNCISRSSSGNSATLRATTCNGPMGLNNTTGAVGVTLDRVDGGVQITLGSSTVKSTTLDLEPDASALYTESGTARNLAVSSMTNHKTGTYTVSWMKGGDCATIDGTVTTPGANGVIATQTFSQYVVCKTGCPRSGTVTRDNPQNGVSVTTTYNGSSTVRFVRSDGGSGTITLVCQ